MNNQVHNDAKVVTFSAQDLNDRCDSIEPGGMVPSKLLNSNEVMERLQAFVAISAEAMLDGDPRIRLTSESHDFLIRREGSELGVRSLSSDSRTTIKQSVEEIVRLLEVKKGQQSKMKRRRRSSQMVMAPTTLRDRLNSPWLMTFLLVVAAVIAYVQFGPKTPPGISIIGNDSRIRALNAQFEGRYGVMDQVSQPVIVVKDSQLQVYLTTASGVLSSPIQESSFRYGQRGEQLLILASNGAVLERNDVGALVFEGTVYPKVAGL